MAKYSWLKIRNLRLRGLTWSEIMEVMGCSRNTVRRALTPDYDAFLENENERKKKYRQRVAERTKNRR
jgi:hypothetical protein